MNLHSGVFMQSGMRLKTSKPQLPFKRQWSCKQKLRGEKERASWLLRERRLLISILLRLKNKHKFLKQRVKPKLLFLELKHKVMLLSL